MVEKSKPSTLSPTIGADNAVISEFDPVRGRFEMGSDVLPNHNNVMKQRVSQNGTTNSILNNTLIDHRAMVK